MPGPQLDPGPPSTPVPPCSVRMPKANSPSLSDHARHPEQPEVGDDHFAVVIEDVLGFEILVHDALGMQIPHALEDSEPHVRGGETSDNDPMSTWARHRAGRRTQIASFNLHSLLRCYCLLFTDEETQLRQRRSPAPGHAAEIWFWSTCALSMPLCCPQT